jgi:hypothetical protein
MHRMQPSEAREVALQLHDEVREQMRVALTLAHRIAAGDPASAEPLRAHARELCRSLRRHTSVEEDVLAPVLESIDAWGGVRRDCLVEEHQRQSKAADEIDAALGRPSLADVERADRLARAVHRLIRRTLRSVRWEEKHLLRADLLCDASCAIVDQVDG